MIMYEMISARHPLWTGGIDKKQYRDKAQGFNTNFKFKSRRFTELSRNLIGNLCNPKPSLRYTVDQALQHPWITRDFGGGQIPRTTFEQNMFVESMSDKLRGLVNTMFFMSIVKKHQ